MRAPAGAVGASATCPKCKSNFTLAPEERLPDWAKGAPGTAQPQPPPARPIVEETRAAAALPDVTEPSPVVPADPPTPVHRPVPSTADEPPQAATNTALVLALGALTLVGPAVLAAQLPFGRAIGGGLAALGLLAGLLCLGGEGKARPAALAAVLLHASLAGVLLLTPAWINRTYSDGASGDAEPERPAGPVAVSNGPGTPEPVEPHQWLDAGKASWQSGGARVSVRSASVGPIELTGPNGAKRSTREPYLRVSVRVRNADPDRELPLSGWAAGRGAGSTAARALDAADRPLAPAGFDAGWEPDRGKPVDRVLPGHTSELVLVFVPPARRAEFVRVLLPGAPFGAPGDIKFRVPLGAR